MDSIIYIITMNGDKTYNIATNGTGKEYNAYKISYLTLFNELNHIADKVNNELKRGCLFAVEG